jgi:AcrR family transcriptional regulator
MKPAELEPAPKRGQYDRALSRRERQDAQRERVIVSLSALTAENRELSVANVVQAAGIGRNTFYEYFDDVEHALGTVRARAVRELGARTEAALRAARTPLERIRAVARAWAEHLIADPSTLSLALRPQVEVANGAQLSGLGEHIAGILAAERDARSALPGLADRLKINVVAAVFEAVSRTHLGGPPMSSEALQGTLSDLALRLLR